MKPERIEELKKIYAETSDEKLLIRLNEGREAYEEGAYDLIIEEAERRSLDIKRILIENTEIENENKEVLLTDEQWSKIDSKMCRILEFGPMASFKDGNIIAIDEFTPYASISFQCSNESKVFNGFITHKEDFKVLWYIYNERKISKNEEVLFFWSKKHYKNKLYSLLSRGMPKLWVMICKKSSFEIHTNPKFKHSLKGEARYLASKPIEEFKPEVMK